MQRARCGGRELFSERYQCNLVNALRELMPQQATETAKKTFGLTPREREIVAEIVAGCTNKDMAASGIRTGAVTITDNAKAARISSR